MRPIKTVTAIVRYKAAEGRLAANTRRELREGIVGENPEYQRLNRAVADAEENPNLPDRYRDPRDRRG